MGVPDMPVWLLCVLGYLCVVRCVCVCVCGYVLCVEGVVRVCCVLLCVDVCCVSCISVCYVRRYGG